MSEQNSDIQRLSPDDLMSGYHRSPVALAIVVAVMLHVVVLAASSVGYIHKNYLGGDDPAQVAATNERENADDATPAEPGADPNAAATAPADGEQPEPTRNSRDDELAEKLRNHPDLKETVETRTPPDDLLDEGFDLNETN